MISQKLTNKLINACEKNWARPIGRSRHFSFILDGNKIVSIGWNLSFKTHPIAKKFGHRFETIHSETLALANYSGDWGDLDGLNMVNLRFNKKGELYLSKPCARCQKMLDFVRIGRVIWSTDKGDFDDQPGNF